MVIVKSQCINTNKEFNTNEVFSAQHKVLLNISFYDKAQKNACSV